MSEKRYENIGLHIIDGYIRRSDGVHLYVPPEIVTELNNLSDENEQLKSKVIYEKRQHKHWKKECLENIKEIAQLKREIVQLKGNDDGDVDD